MDIKNDFLITKKQINYIEILAIDLELSRIQRQKLISWHLDREVKEIDTMSKYEASEIITYLKRLKEDKSIREAAVKFVEDE